MKNYALQRFLLLLAVLVSGSTVMRADTISNFKLDATFMNGAMGTGLVTIDVTTGVVTSINAVVSGPGGTYDFAGAPEQQGPTGDNQGPPTSYRAVSFQGGDNALILQFPQVSLVNYVGGMLCSTSYSCSGTLYGTNVTGNENASTAMLTAVSPEPTSLVLMSTGLAGIASAIFRRKRFV